MQLPPQLTPTQMKILEMASDGFTDKEISASMGIAPGTLRTYWDRLRKRCDSRSRAEVISKMQHALPSKRLRLILLEKMPFFIWTLDENGKNEFCNEWFHLEGKLDRKLALKKGLEPLLVPEEKVSYNEFVAHALKDNHLAEEIFTLTTDEGTSTKRHKVRLFPVPNSKRWICYAREIAADADHQMAQFLMAILT